jgi:hypothetical protein
VSQRRPEVADVIRGFETAYRERFPVHATQTQVLRDLSLCRTAALGGHKLECDSCGHQEISYNSCRNRHCPKCQAAARAEWLAERERDLLDVPYFHVVFTLPEELSWIALRNKRLCYGLLMRTAATTLRTIAADARHLGAEIGFLAVLHTWSQSLLHHPHVHCVVPGGGIARRGPPRWISCSQDFFLPVRVLSRLFRRLLLCALQRAYEEGKLKLKGRLGDLQQPERWAEHVSSMRRKEWVVYAKPPFGGPQQVLKYLARYTHRVAISNARLLSLRDGLVRFRWKDRADHGRPKEMTVDAVEFIRRFLLHVLPKGFMRIRHFGFLANRARKKKLALVRQLLVEAGASLPEQPPMAASSSLALDEPRHCPQCGTGVLQLVETLPAGQAPIDDTPYLHQSPRPP